ncbi:formate dehydrogenase subunit alpha [Palaeococcus ferrophilus]|uniref:formate dehydrogenase subunit alpha n=1 Tax=Palaeococcus ferrophilus TaxID=83868 RepID=UPI00064FF159|nr:formate dehydrogenase subunit alpha [Palaeococcus ferrophilus]
MKRVVCPYCGFGCSLIVENLTVRPDKNSPVNRGLLCPKGLRATEFISHPERLKKPLKRENGTFREISWAKAMEEISSKLLEIREFYGPGAIGFIASSKCSNEDNYLLAKLARILGTNNIDNCARLCHEASVHALKKALGMGVQTNPYEDLERFKVLLIWGYNPADTHPVLMSYLHRARKRGAKIIAVDVRETLTTRWADLALLIRPGTDITLANAMAHVIIRDELYDEAFIERNTRDFMEVAMATRKYTPEYAERITGVKASLIEQVAREFALAGSGALMWGMGLTQHVSGVENVLAIINLALLTGYIGEKGGLYPVRGQNNVQGAAYMGALSEYLPGYVELTNGEFRERVMRIWGVGSIPMERGLYLTEFFDAIENGELRALYIMGENPVVSEPNSNAVVKALKKLDLLVVQDIFPTKTSRYAHYVLPAAAFCEREGSYMNSERRIQWSHKVCEPPGEAKPDWEIITMLGRALGLPGFDYGRVEEVTEEYFKLFPELEERSVEELKNSYGFFLPRKRLYTWGFPTPGGKAFFNAVEQILPWETPDREYPLTLITVRAGSHYNTGEMTLRSPSLVKLMEEPVAYINGADAERMGIKDGDEVIIETRRGAVSVKAVIGGVQEGTVVVPFHFGANVLTNDALNKAGTPELKLTACRLRKST